MEIAYRVSPGKPVWVCEYSDYAALRDDIGLLSERSAAQYRFPGSGEWLGAAASYVEADRRAEGAQAVEG